VTFRPEPAESLVHDTESHVALLAEHELLGVSVSRFAPAAAPAPPAHVHGAHTEAFLVLDGAMRFLLESGEVTVGAGTWVAVPPGVVHTFRLDGAATFLDLHAPSRGYDVFVRALSSAADEEELARARAAFDQQAPPPGGGADPSRVVVCRSGGAEGETIVDRPGRRVTLLVDTDDLAVSESLYGPGESGPGPHVHHHHADVFLVVEGSLAFTLRGEPLRAPAGTFVLVPPNVVHSFVNDGDAEATFFNLHAPSCGFGDYLRRGAAFDQLETAPDAGLDPSSVVARTLGV
jgi:mannose-6-phosphate isomerase-like protein (cupin superfamily)